MAEMCLICCWWGRWEISLRKYERKNGSLIFVFINYMNKRDLILTKLASYLHEDYQKLEPWSNASSRIPSPLLNPPKVTPEQNHSKNPTIQFTKDHRYILRRGNSDTMLSVLKKSNISKYLSGDYRPKSIRHVGFSIVQEKKKNYTIIPKIASRNSSPALKLPAVNECRLQSKNASPKLQKMLDVERKLFVMTKGRM